MVINSKFNYDDKHIKFQVFEEAKTARVDCLVRASNDDRNWRWPDKRDVVCYLFTKIICEVQPPLPNGSFCRGNPLYSFSKDTMNTIKTAFERSTSS